MSKDGNTRMVQISRTKPYKVPPSSHPIWICGCGLSRNKPYCDGSHVKLNQELLNADKEVKGGGKQASQPDRPVTDSDSATTSGP